MAADGLRRCIFECCIGDWTFDFDRRPYHKNCRCALHGSSKICSKHSQLNKISYPIRRASSESSLVALANINRDPPSPTVSLSPVNPSSPSTTTKRIRKQRGSLADEDFDRLTNANHMQKIWE